jgi:hypothetical protein
VLAGDFGMDPMVVLDSDRITWEIRLAAHNAWVEELRVRYGTR